MIERPSSVEGSVTIDSANRYVAFIHTRQEPVVLVDLGSADEVEELVSRWRSEILLGRDDSVSAWELRKRVWEPIEASLPPTVTTVYLCPDGALTSIPWAALPGRRPGEVLLEQYALAIIPYAAYVQDRRGTQRDARGTGGLERDRDVPPTPVAARSRRAGAAHALLAAGTDGAALMDQEANPGDFQGGSGRAAESETPLPAAPEGSWLVVGDVDYGAASAGAGDGETAAPPSARWHTLRHAGQELDALARHLPRQQVRWLTGSHASRQRVLESLPEARWVHLATHGFYASPELRPSIGLENRAWSELQRRQQEILLRRHPLLLSGLVLAGANHMDPPRVPGRYSEKAPILSGEDVAQLRLDQLQLVVLSACESGLGEVLPGEGVLGLQRAFHVAGARNVVASLWQVDDQATATLMQWFYHFLFERQEPPIEALRQAQLTVRRAGPLARTFASARGPRLDQSARQPARSSPGRVSTAPTRLWAGFFLSGTGW